MNVILFGSTGSANVALERLSASSYELVGVYTRHERGPCPHYACENLTAKGRALGLEVVEDLLPNEDPQLWENFRNKEIDVLASVGYHRKIPAEVYGRARYAVNVHPSLLPAYRGSGTANWSIINGEKTIGATVHELAPIIDTGAILMQAQMPIEPRETAGGLREKLAVLMADLLMAYLDTVNAGAPPLPRLQDGRGASRFPGVAAADGAIDCSETVEQVDARFRGVQPWPGAYIDLPTGRFSVLSVERAVAGSPPSQTSDELVVPVANGIVRLSLRKMG